MATSVSEFLNRRVDELRSDQRGEPLDTPPALARVNADLCGVAVAGPDGELITAGDAETPFTIQSISKALAYALALEELGSEKVHEFVDVEPSGEAYHVIEVEDSSGRPNNPMINAGALVVHSLIPGGDDASRFDRLLDVFSRLAGRQLRVDEEVYESELEHAHRNLAIAHLLRAENDLPDDPHEVVDGYTRQCSIQVMAGDLAVMGATLAAGGVQPRTGERIFSPAVVRQTLSVMLTCGMYDDAGDWVSSVGLPAKSGVAGGILAISPGRLGIGAWSPRLDEHGTSVRAKALVSDLSEHLDLHLMSESRSPLRLG